MSADFWLGYLAGLLSYVLFVASGLVVESVRARRRHKQHVEDMEAWRAELERVLGTQRPQERAN